MNLNAITEQDVKYNSNSGYIIEDTENHQYLGFYFVKQSFDGVVDDSVCSFVVDYKTGWFDHTTSSGRRDCGYLDFYKGKKNAFKAAKEIIKTYGRPIDKKKQFSKSNDR